MPETMKLYSDFYVNEVKPTFDIAKTARKWAQDFISFSADFEKKVNDILKEGWTLVNTTIFPQGTSVMITAILKKQI
jgi:hypothetical protein